MTHRPFQPAAPLAAALAGVLLLAGGCSTVELVPRGSKSLLAALGPISPSEAAAQAIDPYDADNRFRGTNLLAASHFGGEAVYVDLYLDAAADTDAGVRAAGMQALGRHGSPEHVPVILAGLRDDDVLVRQAAARALQRVHHTSAIESLIHSLDPLAEQDAQVRAAAAHALGQYAEHRVVQILIAALNDQSLAVNHNTRAALRTLTGQDFKLDTREWLGWVAAADDVFAARSPYTYPAFQRDKAWYEYLPLFAPPPNETASTPVGMSPTLDD